MVYHSISQASAGAPEYSCFPPAEFISRVLTTSAGVETQAEVKPAHPGGC